MACSRNTSRRESLFGMLLLCAWTIFATFILAAAKIAREVKSEIDVFWAILLTTALSIVSLMYITLVAAYYKVLGVHGSTAALYFVLGVAWAVALAAEALDPNNTFPNKLRKIEESGESGESTMSFRARVGLSGVTAFLLLVMALVVGLKVLGVFERHDTERAASGSPEVELGERRRSVEEVAVERTVTSTPRSTIMVVLAKIGIFKERSMANDRTAL